MRFPLETRGKAYVVTLRKASVYLVTHKGKVQAGGVPKGTSGASRDENNVFEAWYPL